MFVSAGRIICSILPVPLVHVLNLLLVATQKLLSLAKAARQPELVASAAAAQRILERDAHDEAGDAPPPPPASFLPVPVSDAPASSPGSIARLPRYRTLTLRELAIISDAGCCDCCEQCLKVAHHPVRVCGGTSADLVLNMGLSVSLLEGHRVR